MDYDMIFICDNNYVVATTTLNSNSMSVRRMRRVRRGRKTKTEMRREVNLNFFNYSYSPITDLDAELDWASERPIRAGASGDVCSMRNEHERSPRPEGACKCSRQSSSRVWNHLPTIWYHSSLNIIFFIFYISSFYFLFSIIFL